MEEFTVYLKNKPGSLARVCDVLYRNGVNIESLTAEGTREDGTVKVVTDDVVTTKRALEQARMPFSEKEILVVRIMDRPGELAKFTQKISQANINIESIYLLNHEKFAVKVNDINRARNLLKEDIFDNS